MNSTLFSFVSTWCIFNKVKKGVAFKFQRPKAKKGPKARVYTQNRVIYHGSSFKSCRTFLCANCYVRRSSTFHFHFQGKKNSCFLSIFSVYENSIIWVLFNAPR
ncbi:hypothetical protein FRX31_010295 [Thalictrum thalictroides]|uniref:Uncharacterized protein n=1 Tax=Thalictrum thalictroides TaxID=46969 RepID=A0A7J6WRX9_THATH|nr:hypothetical protein FRX31_010295 [Thalictrum thalictroides]